MSTLTLILVMIGAGTLAVWMVRLAEKLGA